MIALGVGIIVAADRVHDADQILLVLIELRRDLACHRQGQQGQHAIGLDLEQALHQAPAAALGHGFAQHDEPGEAVRCYAKIGEDLRMTVGNIRSDQGVGVQHRRKIWGRIARNLSFWHDGDMIGAKSLPWNPCAPFGGNAVAGAAIEHRIFWAELFVRDEGVADEFAVALPAQAHGTDLFGMEHAPGRRRWQQQIAQQFAEMFECAVRLVRIDQHDLMAHLCRCADPLEGAGVDLVVELLA